MKQVDIDRFLSKVNIKSNDECWEWQASTSGGRYGKFKLYGRFFSAHRISYIIHCGEVGRLQVNHKCDNKLCVNPNHLYLGTQIDNMRDKNIRNPSPPELYAYGKAKLYKDDIVKIRELRGKLSSRKLGSMFDVSQMTICRIWSSKSWLCKEGYYA